MRDSRPRVAIVRHSADYQPGVRRAAEALVSAGFACDVFYLGEVGSPRRELVNGVRLIRLPGSKSRGGGLRYALEYGAFFAVVALALTICHVHRRYRVIQIHTMPDFLVLAAALPKLLGAKVIAFMQEPSPELGATLGQGARAVRLLVWFEQRALRFADATITVTDLLKQRFVERGGDPCRIGVILNCSAPATLFGATLPPAHGSHASDVVAICHGTIEHRYGHDDILDAVAAARESIPGLRVVITGRGSGVDAMLDHRARLGLESVVSHEGWVSDARLAELLAAADIGIVAQKASAYSNLVHTTKMYDYWMAGLPVIASRLDATLAAFDESVIAYYRPDDSQDLAEQLVRLAKDPQCRHELARNGRTAYERVGWHIECDRYLAMIRRVASGDNTIGQGEVV